MSRDSPLHLDDGPEMGHSDFSAKIIPKTMGTRVSPPLNTVSTPARRANGSPDPHSATLA